MNYPQFFLYVLIHFLLFFQMLKQAKLSEYWPKTSTKAENLRRCGSVIRVGEN